MDQGCNDVCATNATPNELNTIPSTSPSDRPLTFTWRRAIWTFLGTLLIINFVLVLGIRTGRWDAVDFFCPYYTLVADGARQGQLVSWVPWTHGGCPMGFEPQVGAFSPIQLTIGWITGGNEWGFRIYWLLLWCLGGLGILVLGRHLGAAPWLACIGAIGYTFSAVYVAHAEHTSYLVVMSWYPWVLWRLDAAIVRRSLFPAMQAGALWGLSALSGYPGLILGGAGYAVAWGLGLACLDREKRLDAGLLRRAGFSVIALAIFGMTGLAVLAPTYVGFLVESRGYTSRANEIPRETPMVQGALPAAALSTFSSPYLSIWNSKSDHPLWSIDVSMSSIYVLPLLLVFSMGIGSTRRMVWYLRFVGVFFLLLALGGATPLYGWLYDLLPPMRFLRFAAIFRCFYLLTIVLAPMLALGNARLLLEEDAAGAFWKRATWMSAVATMVAFSAFAVVAWLSGGGQHRTFQLGAALVSLVAIWSAVTILLYRGYRGDESIRRRTIYRHLVILAIVDAVCTAALSDSTIYGSRQYWSHAAASHVPSFDLMKNGLARQRSTDTKTAPLNNNLLTKTPVATSYVGLINRRYDEYINHPILGPSVLGGDRIWFSDRTVKVPLTDEAYHQFTATVDRLGKPCIVWSDRQERYRSSREAVSPDALSTVPKELNALPPAESLPVTLREYSPNRLSFEVVAPRDGWLLVTDRWAPGWQANVNGKTIDVPIGNFLFRIVPVVPGVNRIDFGYHPFGFPWLLIMSWTTLGAVLAGTLFCRNLAGRCCP